MIRILIAISLSLFLLACGQKNSDEQKPISKPQSQTLGQTLPLEIRDELLMRATNIDVVFFTLPISMNQDEKYSVNKTVNFIENKPVLSSAQAPAIGRMSIIDNGEVLRDVDIHYSKSNMYFTIYENNKPKYFNSISPAGANFFNNLIKQAGGL